MKRLPRQHDKLSLADAHRPHLRLNMAVKFFSLDDPQFLQDAEQPIAHRDQDRARLDGDGRIAGERLIAGQGGQCRLGQGQAGFLRLGKGAQTLFAARIGDGRERIDVALRNVKNSPAWDNNESEMWMKTAVISVSKFLPMAPELQAAASVEEKREIGIDASHGMDVIDAEFSDGEYDTDEPELV